MGEDIALNTNFAPGLPALLADPGMIEQVIMNLVVNSRDAMPNGGRIDLSVGAVVFNADAIRQHPNGRVGHFLQLEVRDSGTGIAPEHLTRIFEPFFTTKEAGKGTGLGLATVFGIVKQHDGWVEVASELGRGTVFRVYLPASQTGEVAAQAGTPPPPQLKGGTETILVVEDDEAIRHLLQVTLERYGYRVVPVQTGMEAMEMLTKEAVKVDLLITDLLLPGGMSGRELAQELQIVHADFKMIFISGYANDAVIRDLKLEHGFNFLRKPFSLYTLIELVRHRLDDVCNQQRPPSMAAPEIVAAPPLPVI